MFNTPVITVPSVPSAPIKQLPTSTSISSSTTARRRLDFSACGSFSPLSSPLSSSTSLPALPCLQDVPEMTRLRLVFDRCMTLLPQLDDEVWMDLSESLPTTETSAQFAQPVREMMVNVMDPYANAMLEEFTRHRVEFVESVNTAIQEDMILVGYESGLFAISSLPWSSSPNELELCMTGNLVHADGLARSAYGLRAQLDAMSESEDVEIRQFGLVWRSYIRVWLKWQWSMATFIQRIESPENS